MSFRGSVGLGKGKLGLKQDALRQFIERSRDAAQGTGWGFEPGLRG